MSPPLLSLRQITVGFGGRPLFRDVDLDIAGGERLCLVGRNGCGKSTLLRIAAGELAPDEGDRTLRVGSRVAYLPQEPVIEGYATLGDYVGDGLPEGRRDERYRVEALLGELGLDAARPAGPLSGGEVRRAVLARTLVAEPDVLLLDEPTNHLDLPTIEWLERRLAAFAGAFVLISHDRRFLERLTRATLWLDRGVLRRNANGGFAEFDAWADAALGEEARDRAKLDKLIDQETQWSREGISARRTRNQGRLRRLQTLRAEKARQVARLGDVKLSTDRGELSGKLVLEARHLRFAFGERMILRDFETTVLRGDRVGIIGPNGAGKTTLVRLLTGELRPEAGTVKLGTRLTPVYLDQVRSALEPDRTVWDTLVDEGTDRVMVRGQPRHVIGYLEDFLFPASRARSPVGSLSGGERNRLLLAKALARPSNLLVLDEPTNDLDMDTLDVLQEALATYEGTLLLVSHDRDFLDRVVTSTIALDGSGEAIEYAGGYSDYLAQRPAPAPEVAANPKPAPRERRPKPQNKLTFGQTRELSKLPGEIAALTAEVAHLDAVLADADAWRRDPDAFNAAAARLTGARAELAHHEERWLELEVLRETLETEKA